MEQPSSGALLVTMAEERALKGFIPEIKCSGMEMTHYTLNFLANTSHMLPSNQKVTNMCNPTIHTEGREPKISGELYK